METIGERIRELRKEQQMTQPQLARTIGVANGVISFWENNINIPRGDYIALLAKTFNVTTDYILGNENEFDIKSNQTPLQTYYTQDEQLLIEAYRDMSPGKKKALFSMLDIDDNIIEKQGKNQ